MAVRNKKREIFITPIYSKRTSLPTNNDFLEKEINQDNPWKRKEKITIEQKQQKVEEEQLQILLEDPKKVRTLSDLKLKLTKPDAKKITHGGFVKDLLNDNEKRIYEERREKYINDYEINESSDEAILNIVLMEEVIWYRLMVFQNLNPEKYIGPAMAGCQDRLQKALKSLSMTREQRIGTKVSVEHSISDLAARVQLELENEEMDKRRLDKEERELLAKQRQRELGNSEVLEAEYVDLPSDYEQEAPLDDLEEDKIFESEERDLFDEDSE